VKCRMYGTDPNAIPRNLERPLAPPMSPIAGAEHRQTLAHGVRRGSRVPTDHRPQRGDRCGRVQSSASTLGEDGFRTRRREGAKEPDSQGLAPGISIAPLSGNRADWMDGGFQVPRIQVEVAA
jgi:hypothetical protein